MYSPPPKRLRTTLAEHQKICTRNPYGGPHVIEEEDGEDVCIYCHRIFGQHISFEDKVTHSAAQNSMKRADSGSSGGELVTFVSRESQNVSQQHLNNGETAKNNTAVGVRKTDLRDSRKKKRDKLVGEFRAKTNLLPYDGNLKDSILDTWVKFLDNCPVFPNKNDMNLCYAGVIFCVLNKRGIQATFSTVADLTKLEVSEVRKGYKKVEVVLGGIIGKSYRTDGPVESIPMKTIILQLRIPDRDMRYHLYVCAMNVQKAISKYIIGCKIETSCALSVYISCICNKDEKYRAYAGDFFKLERIPRKETLISQGKKCVVEPEVIRSIQEDVPEIDIDLFKASF